MNRTNMKKIDMKKVNRKRAVRTLLITAALITGAPALAAEMDHSQHMNMGKAMDKGMNSNMDQNMNHSAMQEKMQKSAPKSPAGLQKLAQMPASGRAREGGSDGRSVMESIDVTNGQASRCAQASRGLRMLDNAEWSRCGGKPEGAAQGPQSASAGGASMPANMNEHAGHNM